MESAYSFILCLLLGRELAAWAKRGCAAISRHLPPGLLLHLSEAGGWLSSYGRLEVATSPRYGFVTSGPVRGKGSLGPKILGYEFSTLWLPLSMKEPHPCT